MSDFTDKLSAGIKKTKDTVQRMNRITYYTNQLRRLASQQGDFPMERRPGLGKEMTAMYQALWREYQGMGWGIEKFERDVSEILGKNFHAGAIAKHSEEYDNAIKAVDNMLEHGLARTHKGYKLVNGRWVYIDPEEEARARENAEKAQRDGIKKTNQRNAGIAINYLQDAGKRRTERARAIMEGQIALAKGIDRKSIANANAQKAQDDGKKRTEEIKKGQASNAVNKYQEDGMKRTAIEEQKKKAKEAEAKSVSERNGHNNAKNQAESSMAGYEEWKKKQKMKHSDEYYSAIEEVDNYIEHHGILGMKWGIRRYQNPDGSLTELGKKRYESGETQRVIDKWNRKKSIALAKGDVEFARKNIDYLSNAELAAFKERIAARTNLDDLKQQSRKITDEKLKTWASMAGSVSTFLSNGVSAYNNAAKIVNAVTGKQTMPVLKDNNGGDNQKKDGGSITEVWRNNKLEERTEVKKEDGVTKTTKHFYNTKDDKKDEKKQKNGGK